LLKDKLNLPQKIALCVAGFVAIIGVDLLIIMLAKVFGA
jgi:hypothetical protein